MTETERQQLSRCVRIFPHKAVGEGHFAVLLQKGDPSAAEQTDSFVEQENTLAERAHDHSFRMAEKKHQSFGAERRSNMPVRDNNVSLGKKTAECRMEITILWLRRLGG